MAGLSKGTIIGNLGGDPEMRYTAAGRAFTTFSVACNRNYTSADGEKHEETEWFRVTAGGKLAEVCSQYLSKGRRVYIEGRLSSRSWESSGGEKRWSMEINANEVQLLDGAKSRDDASGGDAQGGNDLDSIPF
jgi:single-strand DNA-binding protein